MACLKILSLGRIRNDRQPSHRYRDTTIYTTILNTMTLPSIPTWLVIIFLWVFPIAGVGLAAWYVPQQSLGVVIDKRRTDLSRPAWLEQDSARKWSMTNISDAQRRTLLWIVVFFFLILATW